MQNGLDTGQLGELEEEDGHRFVPEDAWIELLTARKYNNGWLICFDPTSESLKLGLQSGVWMAAELTDTPVKLIWGDRKMVFPSGVSVKQIKELIIKLKEEK